MAEMLESIFLVYIMRIFRRFVVHINENQKKITVTISPTDGGNVGKHIFG